VKDFLQQEGVDVPRDDYFCEACALGKSHREPYRSRDCRATQPGESQKDGYRVWIPGTNAVYQSHDVKFESEEIVTSKTEFFMLSVNQLVRVNQSRSTSSKMIQ